MLKKVVKYLKISLLLFIGVILYTNNSKGQTYIDVISHKVFIQNDSLKVDSLSLIPHSVFLFDKSGNKIDTAIYRIDFFKSLIIFNQNDSVFYNHILNDTIHINYRSFPFYLPFSIQHKSTLIIDNKYLLTNPETFSIDKPKTTSNIFTKDQDLDKKGSISRGISFGNSQDLNVSSGLNLQLAGSIGYDIKILAAITDQNIPIQPEGNTQQLQEFDKVFIELSKKQTVLLAGDFELVNAPSNFLKFNKKAQGLKVSTATAAKDSIYAINIAQSISVSKGRFARNSFLGMEGNQGPYKLSGSDGEQYIVILAGSERVYIDGILASRGTDYDYTIDYNLAEIKFTPQQMMTKDKRIIVEFEYTDKNFVRTIVNSNNQIKRKKQEWSINFYSEQDLKNQALQQDLNAEKKDLLSAIGDSLQNALFPSVDTVEFNSDYILYKKLDTLVNNIQFKNVYVYSTQSDSAIYRLSFSFVGKGRGNYILNNSLVNGRIYQWVAPVDNILQGEYEPVSLLIAPKRKSLLTANWKSNIHKNTISTLEIGMSEHNKNLFSAIDKADDIGFAAFYSLEHRKKINQKHNKNNWLISKISHEWSDKNFTLIERQREQEFERNWNLIQDQEKSVEHISNLSVAVLKKSATLLKYQFSSYFYGSSYQGIRNLIQTNLNKKKWNFILNGSHTFSKQYGIAASYLKHNIEVSKKISILILGMSENGEQNIFNMTNINSITAQSFMFNEYEVFCKTSDTSKINLLLSYLLRFDQLPVNNQFQQFSKADNFNLKLGILQSPKNQLNVGATFRMINYIDTLISNKNNDVNLVGLLDHQVNLFNGFFKLATLYQFGNGLEAKKEFIYVEVPVGQGLFSWTDYNNNNIKELDEFEIATFRDLAKYIRVYISGSEFINVRSNQLNQTLTLSPKYLFSSSTNGWRSFFSKCSTLSTIRIDNRSTLENYFQAYNPYQTTFSDSALIASASYLRNSLFFNRNHSKYTLEFMNNQSHQKTLLVNGFDERYASVNSVKCKIAFANMVTSNLSASKGYKKSNSMVYVTKNFYINFWDFEPSLTMQPNKRMRYIYTFKYIEKFNNFELANEKAYIRSHAVEIKYNLMTKISILSRYNLMYLSYNTVENTPLAFEMLDGYKTGWNQNWSISYMQTIGNNMQCNVGYEGRKLPFSTTVHVGNVQLRAYF